MQLRLIPHETCPTCGSHAVRESCTDTHANGQGFEEREFKCGCTFKWSPNFERLETYRMCPKSQDAIKANKQERDLAIAIAGAIQKTEAPTKMKRSIVKWLPYSITSIMESESKYIRDLMSTTSH